MHAAAITHENRTRAKDAITHPHRNQRGERCHGLSHNGNPKVSQRRSPCRSENCGLPLSRRRASKGAFFPFFSSSELRSFSRFIRVSFGATNAVGAGTGAGCID